MAWARLDDNFHAHPKTYIAGLDGCGLWAKCLSYCAHYLTDGFVPSDWIYRQVPSTARTKDARNVIGRLLDAGMLAEVTDGYLVVDYLKFNPSKAEVDERREKRRAAGAKGGSTRAANAQAGAQASAWVGASDDVRSSFQPHTHTHSHRDTTDEEWAA